MKNLVLLLFFCTIICRAQERSVKFSDTFHSGICTSGSVENEAANKPNLKAIGNEVLIQYSKESNLYDISWMENTDMVRMFLVFKEKIGDNYLYVEEYSNVDYFLKDEMESKRQLSLTFVKPIEIDGKKTRSSTFLPNSKNKDNACFFEEKRKSRPRPELRKV